MIPSALSAQLQQGLADFLRFSFWSSTPGMEHVIEDLLAEPGALVKGPYVSLKLPFATGKNPTFFPNIPLGFTPHAHQEQAFDRLGGRRKRSTLVATGTGSGKTECFLLPILDHCLQEASAPGVKAILIYPMNALATDQAIRIAKLIHGNDKLRGAVTAGLYIGESRSKKSKGDKIMGPTTVITDRDAMKQDPPDILLTNYKMLDYLLLRPGDQGVWRHNHRGTLRFLVVDEIHTFDGAQGTDLACLVRRLKRRLQVDDGSLCCVGTSATLGGPGAATELRDYAQAVFGEPFDPDAVIGESRLPYQAFQGDRPATCTDEPGPEHRDALDPARATDPESWLHTQASLWFGADATEDRVVLGEQLKQHATFRTLLKAVHDRTVSLDDLLARLARSRATWRVEPDLGRLVLGSLLGLVAAARSWRAELPEVRRSREEAGEPRPTERFVDLRLQLWQRELRRMVASVGPRPRLTHSDDLERDVRRMHLPLAHCRECGAMGWTTRSDRDKPHILRVDLSALYRDFFSGDPRIRFLYPRDAVPRDDPGFKHAVPIRVELESLTALGPENPCDGPEMELVRIANLRSTPKGEELTRDCPFCGASESLALVGFRAATLTSVYIDQLFASRFNDDKKLLTFSDSVQDAAHRAGFFGARTWRTNLRIAMLRVIDDNDGLSVAELGARLGATWKADMDTPTWVSTFLAPSMTWLHDWGTLQRTGELPEDSDLEGLVTKRLAFEVQSEFGLQASIGRSLVRTESVAVALDAARLDRAVTELLEPMRNEVPGLQALTTEQLRHFILGLLSHLRVRGGILSPTLPVGFIESAGYDTFSFKRAWHLPAYGRTSRLPTLLVDRSVRGRFETWGGRTGTSWYARWVERCLGAGHALTADPGSTYAVLLPGLVRAGLLLQAEGKKGEQIWGLDEHALRLTRAACGVRCGRCGTGLSVADSEREHWIGLVCLSLNCRGTYEADLRPARDYFGRLYATGDLQRIFTAEHTGLLDRAEREEVEVQFKAPPPEPGVDDPLARKPWYPNLLSCTPTLEMGIDIGDLSTAILCSMPPRQANYLQRIGRAGRRDGNSLVLTVANARPHDLYFYESPEEMMEGEVAPPGVFLDAAAVLERQLTAFCFDRWVLARGDQAVLPPMLKDVFSHLADGGAGHFPFNLFAFIGENEPTILREFREMFAGAIGAESEAHLRRFLVGTDEGKAGLRWNILETFHREQQQRDSLSSKARAIREQIKKLKDDPARPLDWKELLDKLDAEKDALLALAKGINLRFTLEFLTDEGLLPNYAFPESAVRLSSVIWRKKKKVPSEGSKFDTWTYEYSRAPASAISELAPHADFYAGGRRVRIDQVDVSVSEVETWRFCDACNHAQRVDTGDEATSCPSCQGTTWRDDGQRVQMLRLRQVFANAPDRESRIKDDRDDRRPRFFQRQILVDIREQDRGGAWKIDDPHLPFGFEFLQRATFREVNFGDLTDDGPKTIIAGREAVRRGFEICTRCGKVQNPYDDEPVHSFSCRPPKGVEPRIEPCLYLYREFASEALRILLPMADLSTRRQLNSFVAALQAGLQARFGGSVDHLRTTVYSDPVPDSALRKQYLVLFDTVPGGTGYLKQLVTPQKKGGELPLFEALQLALERVEGCRCWNDPERDGCYRCLYAYRNARDMDDTSAQVAADLLRRILGGRDKLEQIESLGDISITGLMDSVLEVRFVEALRLIRRDGRTAKLKPAVVNKKPGYRWALGDADWIVEPQVDVIVGGIGVSIDFVLRPGSVARDPTQRRNPIAVFLDGWEFHKARIGKDLRQRMALLASGSWDVWTFTWADLDAVLFDSSAQVVEELVVTDPDALKSMLQRSGLSALTKTLQSPLFKIFEQDLLHGLPWQALGRALLAARMTPATGAQLAKWSALAGHAAPPVARDALTAVVPRVCCTDTRSEFVQLAAVHDGADLAVVASLDDRVHNLEHFEFKAAWQGYLRLFQLLRGVGNAWFMTRSDAEEGHLYTPIWLLRQGPQEAEGWAEIDDVEEPFRALARHLVDAKVPEPKLGWEIPGASDGAWAEAEMLWEQARVALTSRTYTARASGSPDPRWTVLYLEDVEDDVAPVLAALKQAGAE